MWSKTHLDEANAIFDYTAFLGIKTEEMLNLEIFPTKILPRIIE